jgi:transposase
MSTNRHSVSWRTISTPSGPRIQAQFSRTECGDCTVRHNCTPPTSTRRQLQFHLQDEYEALHAARARMRDPAWLQRYHRRAGAEGTLSQGVRAFGMRRSRYIGLAKTSLQQACTAVAMNVSRVVHWLDGEPRAKTRVTRFAALAAVA